MTILLLAFISFTSPQQIDMLAIEDTLFIAMIESNHVKVYRYESTALIAETDLGSNNNVSLGISGDAGDRVILVASSGSMVKGYSDTLLALETDSLSRIWANGKLPCMEFYDPECRSLFMQRWHPDSRLPRLVSYYCTHVTEKGDEQWILSSAFDPATYPLIWEESLYYFNNDGYIDDCFMGPVTVGEEPMITGLVNNIYTPGSWPLRIHWNVWIHVHEAETDSIMRVLPVGGGQFWDPPYDPRGYCLGSCNSHAVLLWSDTTGTIYSTEVAGSPLEVVSTEPFEFSLPTGFSAIAASRNPDDSGILLCYYSDGYIRARYKENFWFSYEHPVAPTTPVYSGNLTVSGTPDGYWIAWRDGSAYPNIAWIAREIFTGISEEQSGTVGDLNLTASPNPCSGMLNISINTNEASVQIDIYDTSGHLVHSGSTDTIGHYTWDAQSIPAGVYLIRAVQDNEFVDSKVLLIR